jgi:hypothetical protein
MSRSGKLDDNHHAKVSTSAPAIRASVRRSWLHDPRPFTGGSTQCDGNRRKSHGNRVTQSTQPMKGRQVKIRRCGSGDAEGRPSLTGPTRNRRSCSADSGLRPRGGGEIGVRLGFPTGNSSLTPKFSALEAGTIVAVVGRKVRRTRCRQSGRGTYGEMGWNLLDDLLCAVRISRARDLRGPRDSVPHRWRLSEVRARRFGRRRRGGTAGHVRAGVGAGALLSRQ